jgi:hypothetical protein
MNTIQEPKILVYYLSVKMLVDNNHSDEIEQYIYKIANKINTSTFIGEIIFIPEYDSVNSRIECINPKYITDKNLIKEHNNQIKKLNSELVKYIKNE